MSVRFNKTGRESEKTGLKIMRQSQFYQFETVFISLKLIFKDETAKVCRGEGGCGMVGIRCDRWGKGDG